MYGADQVVQNLLIEVRPRSGNQNSDRRVTVPSDPLLVSQYVTVHSNQLLASQCVTVTSDPLLVSQCVTVPSDESVRHCL